MEQEKNNFDLQQAYNNFREVVLLFANKFNEAIAPWREAAIIIHEKLKSLPWDDINRAIIAFQLMPEKLKEAQIKLLERGWYINLSIDENDLDDLLIINDLFEQEIDYVMVEHGKKMMPYILNKLEQEYPQRFLLLKDAFQAHQSGLYSLSIPIMLAQADGISYDLFKVKFFSKKNNHPQTKDARVSRIHITDKDDPILYFAYISPLDYLSDLQINTIDRERLIEQGIYRGTLNRHGVMHGLDCDYANESNSLKCILLLGYLADLKTLSAQIDFA